MAPWIGPMQAAFRRLKYAASNWRFVRESARLKMAGSVSPERRDEIVRAFHTLWYETSYSRHQGWQHPTWLGSPALKCPFDLWIYQEILTELRPDLVVETGTASGGSARFLASVQDAIGHGEVLSIDIASRADLPAHPRIEYRIGSSTSKEVLDYVRGRAAGGRRVMVILDSDHRRSHVAEELRLYSELVSPGSYLVVEDTNINGHPVFEGFGPGPAEAVGEFLEGHPEFVRDQDRERFLLTFNPGGYLRRKGEGAGAESRKGSDARLRTP